MNEYNKIKEILLEIDKDNNAITKLDSFKDDDIVYAGLLFGLYKQLFKLFKPININGQLRIYIDPFSTSIFYFINQSFESKEEANKEALEIVANDKRYTYDELISDMIVIPKDLKILLIKDLYSIDMSVVNKIKIGNSLTREISGWDHAIQNSKDVLYYAEPACYEAMLYLFNNNIRTTFNDTDCVSTKTAKSGLCRIRINYDTLSDDNKVIANDLIIEKKATKFMDGLIDSIEVFVPCNKEDTIEEVSNRLMNLVSRFKYQDILFGYKDAKYYYDYYTSEKKRNNLDKDYFVNGINKDSVLEFTRDFLDLDIVYDEDNDIYWDCEEYYLKHKNFEENKKYKRKI